MTYPERVTVRTEAGVSGRHVGRYVLEDLVAENAGSALWRAIDPALQRPVGARLIPRDDPRVAELRAAAQRASRVHDRHLVRVLDVIEADDYLAIITEWVNGHSWSELLTDRWSPQDAAIVALEVGRALEAAHDAGVTHGRIRPDSVMLTDTREVRVRGLGVEAALWGVEPAGDPRVADVHGVGALLYAGLTRCWPGRSPLATPVDGLTVAPMTRGRTAPPSTVAPDIPPALDDVVGRSLVTGIQPATTRRYENVGECVVALERAMRSVGDDDDAAQYAEGTDRVADRLVGRLSTLAVATFALAGLALIVWQLWANHIAEPAAEPPAATPAPTVAALPKFAPGVPEAPYEIVRARAFDPWGDRSESGDTVRTAIDGDDDTAWITESYSSADLGGKGGVGLMLDLGAVRPVKAINLKLVGTGTSFAIMTSKRHPRSIKKFRTVSDVVAAGDAIKVRPYPVDARFVLVWLTRLPFDGSSYNGGVRTVKVLG